MVVWDIDKSMERLWQLCGLGPWNVYMHNPSLDLTYRGKLTTRGLKREDLMINHKRTERIYRKEGLALRRKRCRKCAVGARVIIPQITNDKSSMDFVTDSFITGQQFCALAVIDDHSRECPAIEVYQPGRQSRRRRT